MTLYDQERQQSLEERILELEEELDCEREARQEAVAEIARLRALIAGAKQVLDEIANTRIARYEQNVQLAKMVATAAEAREQKTI